MPRTVTSPAISSSPLRLDVCVRTTVPSRILAERSRSEASLLADGPAARSAVSGVAASVSGVSVSPTVVRTLPWIAWAARPCELLIDGRADERAKGAIGVAWAMGDRADEGDEPGQHGIACRELVSRRPERHARHG
jgi:hypothetical protein